MNPPIPMPARDRPMRWWYEALADFMIAHPEATQNEIAAHFGRTASTISLIVNSDAFRAYYRQRRADFTERLDDSIRTKLFGVANTSLDNLLSSLEKKRDSIPIEMLHRTTDMALRNLGYGADKNAAQVNVGPTVVNVAVSVEDLQAAREALRRNQLARPSPLPPLAGDAGETLTIDEAPLAGGGDHSVPPIAEDEE